MKQTRITLTVQEIEYADYPSLEMSDK